MLLWRKKVSGDIPKYHTEVTIPLEISAKDVASGLCPDKFTGKPCVSGHRPDATSFVKALLQRFPQGLNHSAQGCRACEATLGNRAV